MMKKKAMVLVSVLMCAFMSGCDYVEPEDQSMIAIEMTSTYTIYQHAATGVYYIRSNGSYNQFTPMLNADGSLYIGE